MKNILCFVLLLCVWQVSESRSLGRFRRQSDSNTQVSINFQTSMRTVGNMPGVPVQVSNAVNTILNTVAMNMIAPQILAAITAQQSAAQQMSSAMGVIGQMYPNLQQQVQTIQNYMSTNGGQVNNAMQQSGLTNGMLTNVVVPSSGLQIPLVNLLQTLSTGNTPQGVREASQRLIQALNSGQFTNQLNILGQTFNPSSLTDPTTRDRMLLQWQNGAPTTFINDIQAVRNYLSSTGGGSASASGSGSVSGNPGVFVFPPFPPLDKDPLGIGQYLRALWNLPGALVARILGLMGQNNNGNVPIINLVPLNPPGAR